MEGPLGRRVFPIGRRIAEKAAGVADDLRLDIAGEVCPRRGLVVHRVEYEVTLPASRAVDTRLAGILEPRGVLAGETNDEQVEPAVAVEIIREREKIIRVLVVHTQSALEALDDDFRAIGILALERLRCRIILVALIELRPLPPIRPGDDIVVAVAIEVGEG